MSEQKNEFTEEKATGEDYQTPIDEASRKTGAAEKSSGKETATPESGSSDTLVEGSPNQGTEKR